VRKRLGADYAHRMGNLRRTTDALVAEHAGDIVAVAQCLLRCGHTDAAAVAAALKARRHPR
jgi:hypothetical protein